MNKYIFVWSKCPLKALKSIQKAYKPFFQNLDILHTTDYRVISSVGSEHYLDRVGVTGSNPVSPTKKYTLIILLFLLNLDW